MATNRCRSCGKPLELVAEYFCNAECKKTYQFAARAYTDHVQGIVIGGDYSTYEFWPHQKDAHLAQSLPLAKIVLPEHDDESAIAWFRQEQPEWFARGVEMRVR